ncbi:MULTISPECIES: hypothetical protein [unclassified Microcoleus]|uniref:hypothetical protein n=1 Tax=unclassified Microcoleus TaxID=2642155 RepID=UPI002FD6DD55
MTFNLRGGKSEAGDRAWKVDASDSEPHNGHSGSRKSDILLIIGQLSRFRGNGGKWLFSDSWKPIPEPSSSIAIMIGG